MDTISQLVTTRPMVALHIFAMLGAVALGAMLLLRRKGTIDHRRLGWAWVVLIGIAGATGMFIHGSSAMPRWNGWSPIHLLVPMVATLVPIGILAVRRGNVRAHRKTMTGLYVGACVIAGAFTLLPGRVLGNLVWKQWLGMIA